MSALMEIKYHLLTYLLTHLLYLLNSIDIQLMGRACTAHFLFFTLAGREGGKGAVFFLLFEFIFCKSPEVCYNTIIIFLYYRVAS